MTRCDRWITAIFQSVVLALHVAARRVTTAARITLERENAHKLILITLCWTLASSVLLAQTASVPRVKIYPKEPPPICKDYVKLLNQVPPKEPLPVCKNFLDQLPGAIPLDWKVIDPLHNPELLYKLEWLLYSKIKPEPPRDHKAWRKQFQRRAKTPATLPVIKQARVSIQPDQPPQLIYSYETAGPTCDPAKLAAWKKDRGFGPFILFHNDLVLDNYWQISWGTPFMRDKHLHVLYSYLSDKSHFVQWAAVIRTFKEEQHPPVTSAGYMTNNVCQFDDAEIFFPPPKL